ncbi:MAG: TIGR03960 family B12-binding radical SAM protein [Clostridiales bacterium]|nr:TIGR03960 family B12-binding radical SAM protein [Clostridiales bacterium]
MIKAPGRAAESAPQGSAAGESASRDGGGAGQCSGSACQSGGDAGRAGENAGWDGENAGQYGGSAAGESPRCRSFTRFAFCFPDVYEIGMSHLGLRILYHVVNSRDDAACERVFAPWGDMERLMRERGMPLFALESRDELRDFDMIGFTLQYELSYSNVLNMLDLAGLKPKAAERGEYDPIVCAGGPCASNPMPMAPFMDFFALGEGEDTINELISLHGSMKAAAGGGRVRRSEFLEMASRVDGVYVPGGEEPGVLARPQRQGAGLPGDRRHGAHGQDAAELCREGQAAGNRNAGAGGADCRNAGADGVCNRNAGAEEADCQNASAEGADGRNAGADGSGSQNANEPGGGGLPAEEPRALARKRVVARFDAAPFPDRDIVPFGEIVHDRAMLELFRGCIRGCRFCHAGYIYRPVREKSPGVLLAQACDLVASTGYEEVALTSLSTSDYGGLQELAGMLIPAMRDKRVNLSLPSLRVDSFSLDLARSVQSVRRSGLTFAPEAGTQRLRDAINKGVTEGDLLRSVSTAFAEGWSNVKLYFMIGLPTETSEDLDGIAELAKKVAAEYYKIPKDKRGRGLNITVSVSSFVPKPFTPFQWEAQDTVEALAEKQRYLKDKLKIKHVTYNWHDAKTSFLEAVFARGDRRVGEALYEAWRGGAKFDGWSEHFDYGNWMAAFRAAGVDPAQYANRLRGRDEALPWDAVDYGIRKSFLWRERERAYAGELTPNCREACAGCGVDRLYGCELRDRAAARGAAEPS